MILAIAVSTGSALQDVAHLDQTAGEGERTDVGQRLVQRVEEHQQELRHRGDRAGDVAQHHDARLLDPPLLPHGDEGNAAPAHVAPERAACVELAAQPPPPRLCVARGQALGHCAHQDAHPVQVAPLEVGQACGFQQLLAELFRLAAGEQQQVALDESRAWSRRYSMQFSSRSAVVRAVRLAQRLDVALHLAQAHAVEDAAGVQVLLGEEADVLDAGRRAPPLPLPSASAARSSSSSICDSDAAAAAAHALAAEAALRRRVATVAGRISASSSGANSSRLK